MKRLALSLVAVALAGAALLADPPADLDPPPATSTTDAGVDEQVSRFFHCPWAFADGVTDSTFSLVTTVATDYRLSLPLNGEVDVVDESRTAAGSGVGVGLSSITAAGAVSGIVEFTAGPAAATVVASADERMAGDACPSALPAVWHLAGGSTRDGERLSLRLFNPFADAARVSLTAISELGAEAVAGFDAISVPARSTRTVDIVDVLPGRDVVSIFVDQDEGSVIPAFVQEGGGDVAIWPATRQSETWELPLTIDRGLRGSIVLTNSSLVPVTFSVDVFDRQASVSSPFSGEIPGPGQVTVPLEQLSEETFGARVTGDGPFAAAVVASSDGARAATPGVPGTATSWLLPGVNSDTGARYRMWALNTGVDLITITYRSVDGSGGSPGVEKINLAAGAVGSVDISDVGTAGVIVEADGPFSVAWTAIRTPAVGYYSAVPAGG